MSSGRAGCVPLLRRGEKTRSEPRNFGPMLRIEWRFVGFGAFDDSRESLANLLEQHRAFVGGGGGWLAGDAVETRLGDGVGKHGIRGAVGIVGLFQAIDVDELRSEMQEQGRF